MNATKRIYRLISISRMPHPEGGQRVLAKLWRSPNLLNVEWWSAKTDPALQVGCLVLVSGTMFGFHEDRQMIFGRLELVALPNPGLNLFETVPDEWGVDEAARISAAQLWETLPHKHRQLFNQILWDGGRFKRYVTARRAIPARLPVSHFRWMVNTANAIVAKSQNDTPEGLADLTLVALLLDVGSLEAPRPNSYVKLLEWLLVAARQDNARNGDFFERIAWKIVQVHALTEQESGRAETILEPSRSNAQIE